MDKLFSIIVPIYNSEEYLHNCLDSILNQKFTGFELIAVDDGSTDRSGTICDENASKDSRVKVIHKKNGGLSSARNAGLDIAEGKYIMFVDSDDELNDNDALDAIQEYVVNAPEVDIFITKTWTNPNFDDVSGEKLLTFLIDLGFKEKKFSVGVWDKVYRHSFIKDNSIMFDCKSLWYSTLLHKSCKATCTIKAERAFALSAFSFINFRRKPSTIDRYGSVEA